MRISSATMCAIMQRGLTGVSAIVLAATCAIAWTGMAAAQGNASIAGFWHVKLVKQDGSLYYQSLQQYHPDGLEMEDAATPPTHPAHVCMGVWKQSGSSVRLYHIIWVYDGDGPPVGYVVLTESNTVSADGNAFAGTYDMKQYDIHDGTLLGHMTGTTVGRRIDFEHPFGLFGTGALGASGRLSTASAFRTAAGPGC